MLPEPIQVTLKVIDAFNQLNIPYLIGGSMASAVQGIVRSTIDADLVVDIRMEQVQPFYEMLKDQFYIDLETIMDAIIYNRSFNLIHMDTMFKVDVFILKNRPFDLNQMQRRILQNIGDSQTEQAYFSSAEDIILAKLEWFRMGGEVSDRQWRDILGVLEIQSEGLDFDYLHKWAVELSIQDLLERAVKDADLSG
ncbi:MAG TPA: hypothetical protein VKF38_02525 [Anaerolineaceae bacterium]|nr:hypothetical protein [Anaerolineaceae bacterium]